MLKLRKDAHNRDVNIVVKDTEGQFTRQLRIAFAIALSIHLVLLFGFHFTKLKFNYSDSPSGPTTVVAETPTQQVATFANTDIAAILDKRIPIPPPPSPELGSISDILVPQEDDGPELVNVRANPFNEEENSLLMPRLLSQRSAALPPIQLVVSGDIHNMLVSSEIKKMSLPKLPQKAADMESARVVFSIAVDKEGKICWYDTIEKSSIASLDALAEKIISTMEFAPSSTNILAKGTVEIHYHLIERGVTP